MDTKEALEGLECPVCLNSLDSNHKVLRCQHTFCTDCLEILHDEKLGCVRCPECRSLDFITSVANLPNNIVLMRLLESMENRTKKEEEAKEKEESSSSSDDEPVVIRKKVIRGKKKKYRKIRRNISDSDDAPVIQDSDTEKDSDSESGCSSKGPRPVIDSESDSETEVDASRVEANSEDVTVNSEVKVDKKDESSSSDSGEESSSSGEVSASSKDVNAGAGSNDSGTDDYYADRSKQQDLSMDWKSEEEEEEEEEGIRILSDRARKRRSGRLNEKNCKVFQMPSRKTVLDGIPSTSSPEKMCDSAKKLRPRRRVNNLTKITSSYNHDPDFTSSDSDPGFIKEEESESEAVSTPQTSDSGSYYSECAKKKKPARRRSAAKKKRPRGSISETEEESAHTDEDSEDEYVPPVSKSRIRHKPEYSDQDEDYSHSDSERFARKEPISKRQRKLIKKNLEKASKFEELKKLHEQKKKS